MLCAILEAAGYSTCSYTSPHLLTYNERVRLGERLATDEELCDSFAAVEGARDDTPLTYFEFGTLAAFQLFMKKQPDFAVLEIGLGGRLDAVNIIDPDIAIVTNIALDHLDWLGDTREAIGKEKAEYSARVCQQSLVKERRRIVLPIMPLLSDQTFIKMALRFPPFPKRAARGHGKEKMSRVMK